MELKSKLDVKGNLEDGSPRKDLCFAKRVVIKIGSSLLTYSNGRPNLSRIEKLVRVISDLINQEKKVALVTSGAVAMGLGFFNNNRKFRSIPEKQAMAAVGQCELMHIYGRLFSEYRHIVGQMLLTRDVIENDTRKNNVINAFESLFENNIIPIINENDTVAVDEIVIGDNDTLSAIVAKLIKADLLILLSDVEGLYDSDPRKNPNAKLASVVHGITDEIRHYAAGAGTERGTGGMFTKLAAAEIATNFGTDMVIACGDDPSIIIDILKGEDIGTLFTSKKRGAYNERTGV